MSRPDEAALRAAGWRPSWGLGAGTHYRRGREHLRIDRAGVPRYHVDRVDPAKDLVGHLLADVLRWRREAP